MNAFYATWPWKRMGNGGEAGEAGLKCIETEASLWEILPIVRGEILLEVCTAVSKKYCAIFLNCVMYLFRLFFLILGKYSLSYLILCSFS